MEYAEVPAEHEEAYGRTLSYAFAPERGPDPDREGPDRPASFRRRGMYDAAPGTPVEERKAEDLLAVCGSYDFRARIRGEFRPLGGVSAVASPPEHRRRGVVRTMLAALHAEYRSEGVAFAALWPFEYPFYRRLGYARVNDYSRLTVPPGDLDGAVPEPAGEFVRLRPDDWERLDAVHGAAATEPLALDRTEDWWRTRVFQSWEVDPFVYGWERDGRLRGYLVYSVAADEGEEDGKTLEVREFVGVDDDARGHLLRFCRNHDSQVERVRIVDRADVRLFDRLGDPRAVETTVRPGPMFRLVDVRAGLEALEYPTGVDGEVVLAVADDHCEWNDRTFRLSVDGGTAACEPAEAEPDVSIGIGALSRLAVGSHPVERLVELGHVTVASGSVDAKGTLEAAFPRTEPFLREGF
ncbi:GNAT family N-acetyltransferase [Halorarum salinum]|uniref:GNAT family N-acetyltransferase n=1 Tax=Halorarum salinum TaxID=2743089 RepID=A0A7D5QF54_9EURY|nr:GNAT family N-acetyltransferase [Halobaculum salinum]QLG63221.1 GNAT family N-acetyltransferase [Halobaculum salinum]